MIRLHRRGDAERREAREVVGVWLSLLGFRKRAITEGGWSLKAWTSAHVYLGLSLIVIATLHTGFQLGWNVHTLAYVLMMLVIVSGIVGIWFYSTIPAELSLNRREMTQRQMLEGLLAWKAFNTYGSDDLEFFMREQLRPSLALYRKGAQQERILDYLMTELADLYHKPEEGILDNSL